MQPIAIVTLIVAILASITQGAPTFQRGDSLAKRGKGYWRDPFNQGPIKSTQDLKLEPTLQVEPVVKSTQDDKVKPTFKVKREGCGGKPDFCVILDKPSPVGAVKAVESSEPILGAPKAVARSEPKRPEGWGAPKKPSDCGDGHCPIMELPKVAARSDH